MTITMIITAVLIVLGLLFMLASLIGIAKLPDFFTRLHAQGVGDTIGAFLILAGMMVAVHGGLMSLKIFLIFAVIVLTNPIGTNLMMIAAINKEDYLGYRSKLSGKEAVSKPEAEKKSEKKTDHNAALGAEKKVQDKKQAEITAPEKNQDKNHTEPAPEKKRTQSKKKPDKPAAEKNTEDKKHSEKTIPEKNGSKKKRRRKPSMSMNKAELTREAEKRGIKVPEEATKREILDLIYAEKDKKQENRQK